MRSSLQLVFVGCVAAHVVCTWFIPSPWLVPDLTLAGLVFVVARSPNRWLPFSAAAGLVTVMWAVRLTWALMLCYILLGLSIRVAARHWDVTDRRVECVLVGSAALVVILGTVWLDDVWSLYIVGLSVSRSLITCLTVPAIRYASASWLRVA